MFENEKLNNIVYRYTVEKMCIFKSSHYNLPALFTNNGEVEWNIELENECKLLRETIEGAVTVSIEVINMPTTEIIEGIFEVCIIDAREQEQYNQACRIDIQKFPFDFYKFTLVSTDALIRENLLRNGNFTIQFQIITKPSKYRSAQYKIEMIENQRKLLNSENFSDVTLRAADDQGKVIHAHKVILATQSEIFKAMFEVNDKKNNVVDIHGIKYDVLLALLEFIYCGTVKYLPEMATDLLDVSCKYKVRSLYNV